MDRNTKESIIALVAYLIVIYGLIRLVGGIFSFFITGLYDPPHNVLVWRFICVEYALFLLFSPILIHKYIFKRELTEIGISPPSSRENAFNDVLIGIGSGLSGMAITFGIIFLIYAFVGFVCPQYLPNLDHFERTGWLIAYEYTGLLDRAVIIAITIFLVIPAEEVCYRGFLQKTFMKSMRPKFAIILAAVILP